MQQVIKVKQSRNKLSKSDQSALCSEHCQDVYTPFFASIVQMQCFGSPSNHGTAAIKTDAGVSFESINRAHVKHGLVFSLQIQIRHIHHVCQID